jgi:hypothetical protein
MSFESSEHNIYDPYFSNQSDESPHYALGSNSSDSADSEKLGMDSYSSEDLVYFNKSRETSQIDESQSY